MELMVANTGFRELAEPWSSRESVFDGLDSEMTMFSDLDFVEDQPVMPADVVEYDNGYILYCEVPGLDPQSLELKIQNGWLVLEAHRKEPEYPQGAHLVVSERTFGDIRREFRLPDDVDTSNISARYKDGVLEVHLARAEGKRPQKIQITYAS